MRGRFAPSPTGVLHLGNLRTALLAWLYARSSGSGFVMRMEDLDQGRSRAHFVDEQLADLAAIGLDWDGEVVFQSQRGAYYEAAIAELDVYECFCTRAEIREAARAPHGPPDAYPGTCRDLGDAERAERRAAGRAPALRVRSDDPAVDDFVVRRNDGTAAYNLAVVVDDADQGIEQVVRGDDLLESTPRQVWLQRALGLPTPDYAHVPLVIGPDGARLAKRHGAVTLRDVPPQRAFAWMAQSLGLSGDSPPELLDTFDPARLPREPTIFRDNP
jgi:glutamyl-tRNA synthetase